MNKIIVVFGATGNLGGKIVNALLEKGAEVRAIVRQETDNEKVNTLLLKGIEVFRANMANKAEIAQYCVSAHCAISALSGLQETIVDAQKIILDALVEAKVKRFIPSDFSSDFTNLIPGKNRNLDWRRDFHQHLDKAPIQATSIFNGAFMDMLTKEMPLIMFKQNKILCWGNPNQKMEFTHTLDVAQFTAEVALNDDTPRYLKIAGGVFSCNDFVQLLTELTGENFKLFRPGGIGFFNFVIGLTKFFSPSKNELYPAWQGMQYMRDMMEGRIDALKNDSSRYSTMKWLTLKEFLQKEMK